MSIIVTLNVMLAKRKMRSKDLAARIGMTEANLSLLKSGKVKGVRLKPHQAKAVHNDPPHRNHGLFSLHTQRLHPGRS